MHHVTEEICSFIEVFSNDTNLEEIYNFQLGIFLGECYYGMKIAEESVPTANHTRSAASSSLKKKILI